MKQKRVVVKNRDGRVIGEVLGDVLTKRVRGSVHMLRSPRAWAVDVEALRQAERLGARWVVVLDTETGERYRASVAVFWEHGVNVERGFGLQVALPMDYWQRTPRGELEAVQLGLFGR